MDFLDPRKRRKHTTRLMIAYTLVAIAIGLGGYILLKAAEGYSVDPRSGNVIQNGLLFVDSMPGGAIIHIDDKDSRSTTAARLILPVGDYKLTIKKDGYRDWGRQITLNERSATRYVYPFLFPSQPRLETVKTYPSTPQLITQSPDRRWLLVRQPSTSSNVVFDEYDTADLEKTAKTLTLSARVLTNFSQAGSSLAEVEWSTDNKHLLLLHTHKDGSEFIIFNRDRPAESININRIFDINPAEVAMRDKGIEELYVLDRPGGTLRVLNTDNSRLTSVIERVLAFKSNGDNLISYVTDQNTAAGQVSARIWDGERSYAFHNFASGNNYLIDLARFQGDWYYVAGSSLDERVNIFKNPLDSLKNSAISRAIPLLSLNIKDASIVSFSTNARFIAAQAGQSLAVYDLEAENIFRYILERPISDELQWMDGHRLVGASNGEVFVTDYDSTNQQLLTPTNISQGGFFDREYTNLLTVTNTSGANSGAMFQRVDMRAGVDLPRQ